ncbi:ATP-binding/permease protein CydD [Arthrobacter agilis]|uniref:thiol reductant ABC exporter subunit CydD n=1 Tax=Arthrobacter agilis TaxID=37921 RepID=UPI000F70631B|nr:thiol reductant ABC exporter subunit CydD [Arthrobacter agilis]VDR31852.1 ATP-binding/permease protein CydD [Arthrobacter agilis]
MSGSTGTPVRPGAPTSDTEECAEGGASGAPRRTARAARGPLGGSPLAGLGAGGTGSSGSRSAVYLLGVLAAARALGLVLLAQALAVGLASLASGSLDAGAVLLQGAGGVVLRTIAAWGQDATAARLALGVRERLREEAVLRVLDDGGTTAASSGGQGSLSVLLTRGLDGLDKYYTQYLPALISCAVVPLLIGARILAADWVSALIIVLTVPLVPVFMALIGLHTQDRTQQAAAALGRLSDHLLELARGLPVLVGLGRAAEQTRALRDIADAYSARTMATLRTVFLSSLALELISTLSVAVVAVFAGVRLVHGDLALETALVALILAPECYGPLRDVGAAHHASEDGEEATSRVRAVIDAPKNVQGVDRPVARGHGSGTAGVRVEGLTARYDGARSAVLDDVSFTLEPGSVTALRGASGSGKTTLMRALAGRAALPPELHLRGRVSGAADGGVAWVPQHPELVMDTVRGELALYGACAEDAPAVEQVLARVDAAALADRTASELSPGELRRVAVARALIRAEDPAVDVLLLDEPTAHVDGASSDAIRAAIAARREGLTVLLIAHDDDTAALASSELWLGHSGRGTVPVESPLPAPRRTGKRAVVGSDVDDPAATTGTPVSTGATGTPVSTVGTVPAPASAARAARDVLTLVRPWDRRFLAAAGLGLGASVFAVALTALSGWLIVRAAEQPPILYLLTAIVGVRFFGIGRSVLRYAERLWLHRAVFHRADDTRLRLWAGLLGAGRSWRTLARGSGGIETLVGDVDELRDISARAVLPFLTAVLTGCAALATTALLHPASLGWQALSVGAALVVAPVVAVLREQAAGAAAVQVRADALGRVTRLLKAAPDLRINGAHTRALTRTRGLERLSAAAARRSAAAAGASTAVIVAACCTASVGILLHADGLPTEITAVLALMQLALIEPFIAGTSSVQHWGPLAAVTRRILPGLGPENDPAHDPAHDPGRNPAPDSGRERSRPSTLTLQGAAVGYRPGRPVVAGVDLALAPGRWTALTGPSGSGKSTLIGALLGFLPLDEGRLLVDGKDARAGDVPRIAWCPQESHLFASSIRANLQLARAADDPASDAELGDALRAVGLGDVPASLAGGLDAQVGAGGSRLSGGQRQRLAVARALLTRATVILLDEPTAHLDAEGARALLGDLREGLPTHAVLLVTHDPGEAALFDEVVVLGS